MKFNKNEVTFILLAAGYSQRMNDKTPKSLMNFEGKPAFIILLEQLLTIAWIKDIILVVNKDFSHDFQVKLKEHTIAKDEVVITTGGQTRFDSLLAGLKKVTSKSANHYIFVHDCARIMLNYDLLDQLYKNCSKDTAIAPIIEVSDLVRVKEGNEYERLDKASFGTQTPQVFPATWIDSYFLQLSDTKNNFRDEISVAEHYNLNRKFITGDRSNMKLTYKLDKTIIELLYKQQKTQ